MKKFIAAIVAVLVLTASFATTVFANIGYVGNLNSRKFHYADCSTLKKMNPNNRVNFSSREAAIAAGYVPCKRCKP